MPAFAAAAPWESQAARHDDVEVEHDHQVGGGEDDNVAGRRAHGAQHVRRLARADSGGAIT
jgi:hypothetical protein